MFYLKNHFIQFYALILIFVFSSIMFLFFTSGKTIRKIEKEIVHIEILHAKNLSKNISKKIKHLTPKEPITSLKMDEKLRKRINDLLSLFSNEQYKFVYLIYTDKQGRFRYLADGSKEISERGEFDQKFDPSSDIWQKTITTKQPQFAIQKNISELWITYLYPILYDNKTTVILAFDISTKEYNSITNIVKPIRNLLFIIAGLLILMFIVIIFQTVVYIQQRKKKNIDTLTHLYNRHYLEEIKKNIDLSQCAIALADIDHFKRVNDNYGHKIGDLVLEAVSKRLLGATRAYDIVIRYGGEEFLIIFNKQIKLDTLREISVRILKTVSKHPIRTDKGNIYITLSMGINPSPHKDRSIDDAIIGADKMLYAAKTSGRNRIVFLNSNNRNGDHILMINEIIEYISKGKLIAFFQPILDIKKDKIVKFEALARIEKNHKEYFLPSQFLPIIKKTSTYRKMTKIMLYSAFEFIKLHNVSVSVNFDIDDFFDNTLFEIVKETLDENRQYAKLLTIEILENSSIVDIDEFIKRIRILKSLGIKIAIDDFGSGYSGFNYIINIKPDILKIDGSIISKILTDENAQTVLKSIVDICKSLNIFTIAEFVESEEILNKLKEFEVDMAQGYLIGKPLDLKKGEAKSLSF